MDEGETPREDQVDQDQVDQDRVDEDQVDQDQVDEGQVTEVRNDRLDELMDDPPFGEHHLGRFAGYEAAKRVRRRMVIVMLTACPVSVIAYVQYTRWLEYQRTHPYQLPEGSDLDGRPREMTWNDGKARLALVREPPGLLTVHLPDMDITLADGCDHAQFKVHVRDGETLTVQVISGDIVQTPR